MSTSQKIHPELFESIKLGDLESLQRILALGGSEALRAQGDDILCWAAYLGHFDMVQWAIAQGVRPDANFGRALVNAAGEGHLVTVQYLFSDEACARLGGISALRQSLIANQLNVVQFLAPQLDSQSEEVLDTLRKLRSMTSTSWLLQHNQLKQEQHELGLQAPRSLPSIRAPRRL